MTPTRFSNLCRAALIILTAAALTLTAMYHPDAAAVQAAADTVNMFQY